MRIKSSTRKFLILMIVFTSLIPDIGIKINTFGFNWTLYRIAVPIGILLYLSLNKKDGSSLKRIEIRKWTIMMALWIIVGILLWFISPYRDFHNGFIELVSLFNGLVCIYILGNAVRGREDLDFVINIVCYVFSALVLLGVIEILTGFHLHMSELMDTRYSYENGATGIFYGVNDFSSFLTAFLPLMLIRNRRRAVNNLAVVGTIFILISNDANICIFALIIGIAYYFIFLRNNRVKQKYLFKLGISLLTLLIFLHICLNLSRYADDNRLFYVISTQIDNLYKSQGSLWKRLTIYRDSLKAAESVFFLGIGPSSFANYFTLHPSVSGLVDPHNLYLEIIVEYGFVIFLIFVSLLFKLLCGLRKQSIVYCTSERGKEIRCVSVMILIYSVVCISSSSFIGYAWQWVLIVLGLIMIDYGNSIRKGYLYANHELVN